MTDIKEAREIELKSDWDLLSSPSRRIAEAQQAVIDQLRDALQHIQRTCKASRTETRRLRCIDQRAQWALDGKQYSDDAFDLPKDATHSREKLALENKQLRERVAELESRVSHHWKETAEKLGAELGALKSAPVVMPERRHIDSFFRSYKHDLGWNACLDKFESLNRSKT